MPKRTLQGVVVSDKQAKTVVVRVDRRFTHPIYKKTIRRSKNYHAHDENSEFKPGDMVWIEEADLQVEALDRGPGRAEENRLRFIRPGRMSDQ
jgi:small subunit ribosomal protein S17